MEGKAQELFCFCEIIEVQEKITHVQIIKGTNQEGNNLCSWWEWGNTINSSHVTMGIWYVFNMCTVWEVVNI